ncbi:MAG: hypothetical protein AAGJ86_00770 [Pseudomonadota bacterium]
MIKRLREPLRTVQRSCMAVITALALTGCGATVNVPLTPLPDALVEPLPLTAGVRMQETLTTYRHEETLPTGEEYAINVGPAAEMALNATFEDMFTRIVPVAVGEPVPAGIDLLIDSDIDALEFALPSQTVTEDYAVWIKFKFKVYDSSGALQSEFPLPAYGKATRDSIVSGQNAALTSAANLALRDAAVLLLTRFQKQSLLAGNQIPEPEAENEVLPVAEDRAAIQPAKSETDVGAMTAPPAGEQFL